ncbi:MAG: hypothetical protein Q8O30_05765 [Candidatus Omnitrophota bacterium]|nr:hypothetical protein [Candidatus Omnitrophota bacterium]
MNLNPLIMQTGCWVIVAVCVIIGALATYGANHYGRMAQQDRDKVAEQAALTAKQDTGKQLTGLEELLKKLNEEHNISKDLYIKSISIYWIEEKEEFYRVGLLLRVLNKNNTRSFVVNAMGYQGPISLEVRSTVSFHHITTGQNMFGSAAVAKKQYFIKPGVETYVDFELNKEVNMTIADKKLPPTLRFDFKWFLDLDKDGFLEITSSQGGPFTVETSTIISRQDWDILVKNM